MYQDLESDMNDGICSDEAPSIIAVWLLMTDSDKDGFLGMHDLHSSFPRNRLYSCGQALGNLCNCRIHQVTASMTTIDLIINLGQDVLKSVTALFKVVAFKLCTLYIFQSVLPLLLFSSYPLPILTMHRCVNVAVFERLFSRLTYKMQRRPSLRTV